MLKGAANTSLKQDKSKHYSTALNSTSLTGENANHFVDYVGPLQSGLNRRAFLKTASAVAILGGLPACKPDTPVSQNNEAAGNKTPQQDIKQTAPVFNQQEQQSLTAVQMQLLPDDGNGPSAVDINALGYLEWAMTDAQNINDGDPEFIRKGIGWLNDLAEQTQGDRFEKLSPTQQDKVLQQISRSNAGENWLSILMYYLTEALLLDPIYGGNTNQKGWVWLEHQAGFPRPEKGKTYRDFE